MWQQPGTLKPVSSIMQNAMLCWIGVQHKLPLKNVGGFGLSPTADRGDLKLAAWVPEGKGAPGFVGIWDVNSLAKSQDAPAPAARRSFFRVSEFGLLWMSIAAAFLEKLPSCC